jgi:peptidoglycan hydrolase CwlO-like protein
MPDREKRKAPRSNGSSDIHHLKKRIKKTAEKIHKTRGEIDKELTEIEKQEKALLRMAKRKKLAG